MKDNCLLSALAPLKESSRSAIADAVCESFSDVKKYLHIERTVEAELEAVLKQTAASDNGVLVLVCGNVGDGKSHLISALRQKKLSYFDGFDIYNDATESSSPDANNIDELQSILSPYADRNISRCKRKTIIAINLGTLNNFIVADHRNKFSRLAEFVQQMQILEIGSVASESPHNTESPFQFVSLCDHKIFHLTENGSVSDLIEKALENVACTSYENPFRKAYENCCQKCAVSCPIRVNYELLGQLDVRKKISALLIQTIVKHHHIISIRSLYSFVYDLLVPVMLDGLSINEISQWVKDRPMHSDDYVQSLLPNYLFEHPEVSKIYAHLHYLDPALKRSAELDERIIRLVTSEDVSEIITQFEISPLLKNILKSHAENSRGKDNDSLVKTYVRLSSLTVADAENISFEDRCYAEYMSLLHGWFRGERSAVKSMYKLVLRAVMLWNGKSVSGEMLIDAGNQQLKYRLGEKVTLKPGDLPSCATAAKTVHKFASVITLHFKVGEDGRNLRLHLDCRMYDMLRRVVDGYRVNPTDKGNFISFNSFVADVMRSGELTQKVRITESETGKHFILARDDFGDFTFKSEVSG